MKKEDILDEIKSADMVLVGLGEEFDAGKKLNSSEEFLQGRERLKEEGYHWLQPAWDEFCINKIGDNHIDDALEKLASILEDKNYFVVSTSINRKIAKTAWKQGRLVMPCGTTLKKQCVRGCSDILEDMSIEDDKYLEQFFEGLYTGISSQKETIKLGKCSKCGADMILNNIYAENYNETGYIEQWNTYTKWLQGTLNHRLVVLELGVNMHFPTVIRWPFEKVAFFNNKATFIRVNENLYQLTEELTGKGVGIPQNAIEWLRIL